MLSKFILVVFLTLYSVNASVININILTDGDSEIFALRSCDSTSCDRLCRRLGFRSGWCVENRCQCEVDKGRNQVETINLGYRTLASDSVTEPCDSQVCDQECRSLGYSEGVCVEDICSCFIHTIFNSAKDTLQSRNYKTADIMLAEL